MTTTKFHATQEEQLLLPMRLPIETRSDQEKRAEHRRWNEAQREQKLLVGLERARDIFH